MKLSLQEKTYRALAHERRLEIVRLLKINKELTVGQIARATNASMQTASKQLQVLSEAHIIASEKNGLEVTYWIRKPMSDIVKFAVGYLQ
ncbi:MAG: hypothetical protein JWM20_756 [Patescibacteria group bacterium]|nr:hypothetical protein [Patescibacteria group bacterium]